MKTCLTLVLMFVGFLSFGQNPLEKAFTPFVGGTWLCDTTWSNGQAFKQEISYAFDLKTNIVQVTTLGFLDPAGTNYGKRNHGIRYLDPQMKELQFIEFDVYGGVTTGGCMLKGDSLLYEYAYDTKMGMTWMTEMYIPIDKNTFQYQIGVYENGQWVNKYMDAYFRRKSPKNQ